MIKNSLFASEERETKLNQVGDILLELDKHVDFAAFTAAQYGCSHLPSDFCCSNKHKVRDALLIGSVRVERWFNPLHEEEWPQG